MYHTGCVRKRPDEKKRKIMLLKRMTNIVKIIRLVNNLKNILCQEIPKNSILKKDNESNKK